jgi:hypothetical protein
MHFVLPLVEEVFAVLQLLYEIGAQLNMALVTVVGLD